MKKILITLIILLFTSSMAMAAAIPFSADTKDGNPGPLTADADDPTQTSGTVQICKPSNNVFGHVIAGPSSFSAATLHMNGTFQYATSSEDTKIYRIGRTTAHVGTATMMVTLTVSDTGEFADWKAL